MFMFSQPLHRICALASLLALGSAFMAPAEAQTTPRRPGNPNRGNLTLGGGRYPAPGGGNGGFKPYPGGGGTGGGFGGGNGGGLGGGNGGGSKPYPRGGNPSFGQGGHPSLGQGGHPSLGQGGTRKPLAH